MTVKVVVAVVAGIGFAWVLMLFTGYVMAIATPGWAGDFLREHPAIGLTIWHLLVVSIPTGILAFVFGLLLGYVLKTDSLVVGVAAVLPYLGAVIYYSYGYLGQLLLMWYLTLPHLLLILIAIPIGIRVSHSRS